MSIKPRPSMLIEVDDEQSVLSLDLRQCQKVIQSVITAENQRCDAVSLHFVSKEVIAQLHGRFFGDFSSTDCISLPIDEGDDGFYRHLGEVFVCPEVACDYVAQHGGDPYEETLLYVIHGLLHLLGYDDLEDETEAAMRAAEERHLSALRAEGLLAHLQRK